MLSNNLEKLLNTQMNNEFHAEYTYLAMAAYFHKLDLDGIANYFHVQANEERAHALKIFQFLLSKGGTVVLKNIEAPSADFKGTIDVFERALEQEKLVTKTINSLMDIAIKENDHAVHSFLRWYVDEQVEEEALATKNLSRIKLTEGKGQGLLIVDQELSKRITADDSHK
ncbi:MAG: ferritin [Phycisphaerales bacterium]|nr:ferritin [Phycisphaerales bacterium]